MVRRNWTKEELILALKLYFEIPFGKIDQRTPEIIALGQVIGRSPGAVGLKLANFARLDPYHQGRGVSGLKNGSKKDEQIWQEYSGNLNRLAVEAAMIQSRMQGKLVDELEGIDPSKLPVGEEVQAVVMRRVTQGTFRKVVLAAYDGKCAITQIDEPGLLVAGHIRPWSKFPSDRMDPQNGICLNGLHDKAFEVGLITIFEDMTIGVSSKVREEKGQTPLKDWLGKFDGLPIHQPERFHPKAEFLHWHNQNKFQG